MNQLIMTTGSFGLVYSLYLNNPLKSDLPRFLRGIQAIIIFKNISNDAL